MGSVKALLLLIVPVALALSCLDPNVEKATDVYRYGTQKIAERARLDVEDPVPPLEFNRIMAGLYLTSMDEAARAWGYEDYSAFRDDMETKISKRRLAWIEQTVLNELKEKYVRE